MHKRLHDKVALITGGSRGIGAAIARSFAKEGCHIAFSFQKASQEAKSLVKELEQEAVKVRAVQADQAAPSAVEALVQEVGRTFGKIDILVNNAGIYVGGSIEDQSPNLEEIKRLWTVNVAGVFTTTHATLPLMRDGGRIILIGSINGERLLISGGAHYAATKAALVGYTHGWARDLGPRKITVNLVQPGPIDTDMNPANSAFAEMMVKNVALGRYGRPEEIASVVTFLASEEASYMTGATVTVDGGYLA